MQQPETHMFATSHILLVRGYLIVKIAAICMLLSGCLLMPGLFQTDLVIRQDDTFSFHYTGEIMFIAPDIDDYDRGVLEQEWSDSLAQCENGDTYEPIPCSAQEVARQRNNFEARQNKAAAFVKGIADLTGFNPIDRSANEAFARQLESYPGWKSVNYKEKGIFEVDYAIEGSLDRDFIFPVLPNTGVAMPFIAVRKRSDGTMEVDAAGLSGKVAKTIIDGKGGDWDLQKDMLLKWPSGTFLLTTDAGKLETNGESSFEDGKHVVRWDILPWASHTIQPSAVLHPD